MTNAKNSYRPPVDQLLQLGKTNWQEPHTNFTSLGLTREHVPELIRMATDDELHNAPSKSKIVYAPVHAWWALAELRAEEAIVPLLGLLRRIGENHDDSVGEAVPRVLGQIGPASIQPAVNYLANPAHRESARFAAAQALSHIAENHPECRAECISRLASQLEKFAEQSPALNGLLMAPLLDLKAVEAAPVMEKAFASGHVNETISGDWEDAQIELGLKAPPASLPYANLTGMPYIAPPKTGRNEPCPCGSGKKYKKCCGK